MAKRGRNGLYCPRRKDDNTWCDWKLDDPKPAPQPKPEGKRRAKAA